MQLFQINQSEDSSKITIKFNNTCDQLHQRSVTSAISYISDQLQPHLLYINEGYSESVCPPAVALRPPPTVHLILPEPGVAQTPVSAQSLVRPLPQQL